MSGDRWGRPGSGLHTWRLLGRPHGPGRRTGTQIISVARWPRAPAPGTPHHSPLGAVCRGCHSAEKSNEKLPASSQGTVLCAAISTALPPAARLAGWRAAGPGVCGEPRPGHLLGLTCAHSTPSGQTGGHGCSCPSPPRLCPNSLPPCVSTREQWLPALSIALHLPVARAAPGPRKPPGTHPSAGPWVGLLRDWEQRWEESSLQASVYPRARGAQVPLCRESWASRVGKAPGPS